VREYFRPRARRIPRLGREIVARGDKSDDQAEKRTSLPPYLKVTLL